MHNQGSIIPTAVAEAESIMLRPHNAAASRGLHFVATTQPRRKPQTARAAADEAYSLCVTIVNAFAVAQWEDGQSPYDTCIDRVNQDQDYYVNHVFPRDKKLKTIQGPTPSPRPSRPSDAMRSLRSKSHKI